MRRLLKEQVIEVEVPADSTVRQVVDRVVEIGGEGLRNLIMHDNDISGNLIVMLNKKDVETLGGTEIVVHDGDEVAILPHVQGG